MEFKIYDQSRAQFLKNVAEPRTGIERLTLRVC